MESPDVVNAANTPTSNTSERNARTIHWDDIRNIRYLRNGSGTSLYLGVVMESSRRVRSGQKLVVLKAPKWDLNVKQVEKITEELKREVMNKYALIE